MEVRIQNCKPMRVVYVRHVGPYQECGTAWQTLMAEAGKLGLIKPDVLHIGVGHDSPDVTPANELRYDACLTVDDKFQPSGELSVQELAGGEYAVVTHRGSYAGLPDAYRWIMRDWIPTSGRKVRHVPLFEIYLNDPSRTPEADLITEIYVPLES
jgi:AraC family transcriptional regulator